MYHLWLNQPVRPMTFRAGTDMRPGMLPFERLTLIEGAVIPQVEVWKGKRNKLVYRWRPRRWRPRSTVRHPNFGYGLKFTIAASRRRKRGAYCPLRAARPNEFYNPDMRDGSSW